MKKIVLLFLVGVFTVILGNLIPVSSNSQQINTGGGDYLGSLSSLATNKKVRLERDYIRLKKELEFAARQSGVSPDWYVYIMRKVNLLQKQGLDADRVSTLRSLLEGVSLGGEKKDRLSVAPCPVDKQPMFTHPFTDLSNIRAINPIGGIGGGSPGRSYVGVNEGKETAIYAPVNATLRTIVFADRGAGYGEYGLIFEVGCGIEVMFDHIDSVSPKILQYAPKVAYKNSQTQSGATYSIPVTAGELLGYTNGTDLAHTFDFLVMDYSKKNSYINPKRWEWEQALYPVCPYDFFTPDLRAQYYEKMGMKSDSGFVKAPDCGNPSHDVPGTLSGGWFKEGSTDKRGEYLAVAHEYDGVRLAYRKDGNAFASTSDVQGGRPYFNLYDARPTAFPEKVTAGGAVCYSNNREWAYLRLDSASELSMARGEGTCPAGFPKEVAEKWAR